MSFFKEIALPLIERQIPVIPLRPKNKAAFLSNWETLASTDPSQIDSWDQQYPDANCGSVALAKPKNIWVFEYDSNEVPKRVLAETGKKLEDTFRVTSSPGRGHVYFRQTSESIAMGNIAQSFVLGGDWSARVDNQYVVSPGSIHSKTGKPYEVKSTAPIIEAPQWFIDWCVSQKVNKKKLEEIERDENNQIPHGFIHDILVSQAGKLIHMGLPPEVVEEALLVWAHKNCAPPLDEEHIRQIARSTDNWKRGNPLKDVVLVGGRPAGSQPQTTSVSSGVITKEQLEALVDRSAIVKKPVFPEWTMAETSIYRNLVEPALRTSNKISYLIFMPTIVAYMNYLSTKVQLKGLNAIPLTMFLGSIACKGTYKSSCAELGFRYLNTIGISDDYSSRISNANGKQLLFTVGSTEALGIRMEQVRCRNAVLYYDELRKAAKKMGIDGSSFSSDLITVYESGKYANDIKENKKSFYHAPGTYCVSWIFCSTIKAFQEVWPRIILNNSDLLDRMFFVLGPEKVSESDEANLYTDPDFINTCSETRQLIDKALEQKIYDYEDYEEARLLIKNELAGLTTSDIGDGEDSLDLSMSRLVGLTQKLALFFAVDLGLDSITSECLERATALVKYRCAVIRYLRPIEADSILGRLQQLMIHVIRSNQGQMLVRQWKRLCHYDRYDTELWFRAQKGLIQTGKIRLDTLRAATGHDHNTVTLLKDRDWED